MNRKRCDILIAPPYRTDITDYVIDGENEIEILVYNTAANQFYTSPSLYKGSLKSGILG